MVIKYFKMVISIPVLILCIFLWLVLLCIFFIPMTIVTAYRYSKGTLSYNGKSAWPNDSMPQTGKDVDQIIFDRVHDVSKFEGCNTRNVQYRWDVFQKALNKKNSDVRKSELRVLDFGAGSMRETYELSLMGYNVDAIDINIDQLKQSYKQYPWENVEHPPKLLEPVRIGEKQEVDNPGEYDAITAFDVIEHLLLLDETVAHLRLKLKRGGILLATVPNRRTLFEKVLKIKHDLAQKRGSVDLSGAPHVTFKTPKEWRNYFEGSGFTVVDHEMGIGFFVNDVWNAVFGIPMRFCVDPVISSGAKLIGKKYRKGTIEKLFSPKWLMKFINELDEFTKKQLHGLWAWNLFVLTPA